ncbi:MAG: class I SAM-dependent methyltransferase [Granulosicoccus sp.]
MNDQSLEAIYDKETDYYGGVRSEMLQYFPESARTMLDVGCGEGLFGKTAKKKFGAEVWGIDINKSSVEQAENNLDKAFFGDVSHLFDVLPDKYFDVIYFNDVLEHMVDPYRLLKDIQSKLSANGLVVASIPNIRYHRVLTQILLKRDFKYEKAGVMDETHMRFFTQKSIRRMFVEAGYEPITLEPINKGKSIRPLFYQLVSLGLIGRDISYPQFAVTAGKAG